MLGARSSPTCALAPRVLFAAPSRQTPLLHSAQRSTLDAEPQQLTPKTARPMFELRFGCWTLSAGRPTWQPFVR